MNEESWPPRDADEMLALQSRYGDDAEIASAFNRTRKAVCAARNRLNVPAPNVSVLWTQTNIELLTDLWSNGLSARKIAEEIGGKCTRNSVIGKAHRIGLPSRPSPIDRKGTGKYSRAHRKKRADSVAILNLAAPTKEEPEHGRVDGVRPLAETTGPVVSCQWIEREPGTPMCGKRSRPGKPYCESHCKRAYMTLPKRRTT